jgi:hypothetical protein
MHEVKRSHRALFPALVLLMTVTMAVTTASPATADASGTAVWSGFTINIGGQAIRIPGGTLHHEIDGSGRNATLQRGVFTTARRICNWRLEFTNWDVNGDLVWINRGAIRTTCTNRGERRIDPPRYAVGEACVRLIVTGRRIANQCHHIGSS